MTELRRAARPWPPRRTGPTKAEARYDQIYETAARLFHEKGYGSTSLQDLANEVGLQKGSLYHYIASKEDLLFGITEYAHTFFTDLIRGVNAAEHSPLETIEEALRLHAEFAAEHFHVTAAFYRDRSALSQIAKSASSPHVMPTRRPCVAWSVRDRPLGRSPMTSTPSWPFSGFSE